MNCDYRYTLGIWLLEQSMFSFNEINQLQLEITNRCQASCPMCPRNIHGGIDNPSLTTNDWSYDDFIKIITKPVLEQIKLLMFCGDFGDPILNKDLIKMCRYVKDTQPNIRVEIYTNGSARNSVWWKELAQSLPSDHTVIFAIDGLEDTHHLYRIGTNYNQILDNAKDFMSMNGIAEWCYIRFNHNQHQVETARKLSNELGFSKFSVKNSKRFSRPFPVVDNTGNVLYNIEQTSDSIIEFVGKKEVSNHNNWELANDIHCQSVKDKELYIDAHYILSPCCMIGAFLYTNYDVDLHKQHNLYTEDSIIESGYNVQQQILGFVEELGGYDSLNTLKHGLENIVNTVLWQNYWQRKWDNKESSACILLCSSASPYITTKKQKIE